MLLQYIPTEDQDANILTKALTKRKFEYHRGMIKVSDNLFLIERECKFNNKMHHILVWDSRSHMSEEF